MLRVPLNLSYVKSTLRPLYAFAQATPASVFIDPAWDKSVDIYPGMVLMKTAGENVTLINATGVPYGLAGFYMAPAYGIDQVTEQGVNAAAAWVLGGPDAQFEVLAPAFDTTATWTEPGDGTLPLVYAQTAGANRGKLVPVGTSGASSRPVARLLKVESTTSIIIGGLGGTV